MAWPARPVDPLHACPDPTSAYHPMAACPDGSIGTTAAILWVVVVAVVIILAGLGAWILARRMRRL